MVPHGVQTPRSDRLWTGTLWRVWGTILARFERFGTSWERGVRGKVSCYVLAALLTMSIAPFTTFAMIPTNFTLISKNEKYGGARSEASAASGASSGRSAEESVDGKGDVSQWTDLSGPMGKTRDGTSDEGDREVKELLGKFGNLNAVRAVLMGVGGVVGLLGALA